MEQQQVEQLIAIYGNKLPIESIFTIREKLLSMDYNTASIILAQAKDPTISIILSIIVGSWGIDRIYIGDVGLGIIKLLTCGGCGIWWLIDLFLIMDATKRKNLLQITEIYGDQHKLKYSLPVVWNSRKRASYIHFYYYSSFYRYFLQKASPSKKPSS